MVCWPLVRGPDANTMRRALAALRQTEGVEVLRLSPLYETRPVGGPAGQGPYLNAVAEVRSEREAYDLLVMTWLPDQASVPHDHSGSICAMQVVQGEAVEGCYQVAPDGYVDGRYLAAGTA